MPDVISEHGQKLLRDLPPYLDSDPWVQTIVDVCAREWKRIEDTIERGREKSRPYNADDEFGFLSMWETLLDLPVQPAGATVAQRRAKVVASLSTRKSGSGADWIARLSEALGGMPWTHQEGPSPYQVTIFLPVETGTYTAEQVSRLARKITPAHLDISLSFGVGFIVESSFIGIQPL